MTLGLTVKGMTPDEVRLTNELFNNLERKRGRNTLRTQFYEAKNALPPSKTTPPTYQTLNLVLGWTAKAVDLLSRRMNLDSFVWPDGDINSIGFQEVWDGNMLGSEVDQGVNSALIHSTAFVVTTAGGKNEPESLMHFKSALDATGEWDARTRRLTSLLSITDRDPDSCEPTEFALYLDGLTITAKRESGFTEWAVTDRQKHPWGVPADPLPYKPRLGRPFGSSRISRPLMSIQCQAVRELYRLEGHMDVFSWPEYWMLGADESIFVNPDGSPKAQWQVMLGRIKGIPDDEDAQVPRADVKQFAAAAPDPHLAALNAFAKLFARESSLPDSSLAITDFANPTSAESYDASQFELIAEAEGAVDDMNPGLRRAMIRSLAIQNGLKAIPDEWLSIDTKWRDPRYLSRSAQADAGTKQLASVSWLAETEVGLELLGLSESQIKRALAEKRRLEARGTLERLARSVPEPASDQPPEEAPPEAEAAQ